MEENFEYKLDELKRGISELLERANSSGGNPEQLRDQIAGVILADIKRTMEEKHGLIQEQLYAFENMIKSVTQNSDSQKLLVETTRIASDLNTVYTRISAQEMLLQNMYKLVDNLKNDKTPELVERLNNEFINFSRGFENITAALNRNFTEFLAQVQGHSAKEEIKKLSIDLDGINSNTNAIISALAIIDHKYQDLKGLITLITDKENTFIEGLQELNRMGGRFNEFAEGLRALPTREDNHVLNEKITSINTFLLNLRTQLEAVDSEQKTRMADYSLSLEARFSKLLENTDNSAVAREIQLIYTQLDDIAEKIKAEVVNKIADFARNLGQQTNNSHAIFIQEIENVKNHLNNLDNVVSDFRESVNNSLDGKIEQLFSGIQNLTVGLSELKSGDHSLRAIQGVKEELAAYRVSLINANKESDAATKQLIENALSNIENLRIGTQLKQLAVVVEQNATNIKETFRELSENFAEISKTTNIEVLKQLNSSIPEIADKLEIFKTVVANENAQNISKMEEKIAGHLAGSKADFEEVAAKLTEKIETNATNVSYELVEQKTNLDKLITTIEVNEKDFIEKFKEISSVLENVNKGSSEELGEIIEKNTKTYTDNLLEIKKDILSQILTSFESSRTNVATACEKVTTDVSSKIATSNGLVSQNVLELKSAVEKIESKLDFVAVLSSIDKIKVQIEEFSDSENAANEILRVSDKTTISKIEDLVAEISALKTSLTELTLKGGTEELNSDALKEFISGLEFLQSSFIDDMKDEFKIHQDVLKKLRDEEVQALDETNLKKVIQDAIEYKFGEIKGRESVNYTLDDVESDFAKLRLQLEDKQDVHLPERLDEIRNIGLENIRLNKKTEKQVNSVADWLDSTSKIIKILAEKVEKAEKLSVQEIKTRLIKSETAPSSEGINENIEEFRAEMTKKYQIQEMKIENVDEKLATLIQKQGDIIDMKSFIDAFHENATQTKALMARVEGIENQISAISGSLEKIIAYIEE